ncbi:hypothetical protein B0P06_001044 [Clostridium saccharoperbutylacetonicum]|uniref:Cell wall binding repeat-containing protein n=1 Tax=Clostridium saccharoperbutylacetonicum N1-4(HMT) TaxID=931276 RepID=M1MET0_9CLOT|nr:hypothetical protein [Clostridium saccharoperbutylacetonicum]AGF54878.1 cell wall binding repeat-containing protein [Clostridium saccharoperbutylacetonicum N1-4(HMT)]NSB27787.1 hypothetical protein [Clostridium saccharoperbutylacetonicum]NSB41273.1 hypothetical protein [Clostridium saccharoperbutylacetonicum]
MKKTLSFILLIIIILSCIFYKVYILKGNEEIEVLNADVSINNIKSIINIENETNDDFEEIPLGYINGNIYLIKYDNINKKLYDTNIFILDKAGNTNTSGIKLPDDYLNFNLNIYGDKIFGKNSYFNWKSGKEYPLLSNKDDQSPTSWYSISGNSDYFLCSKNLSQKIDYILYNISTNDQYKFECSFDSEDIIGGIFYDNTAKNFYAICQNNVVKKINFDGSNFTLVKYDDIKINNSQSEVTNNHTGNYLKYTFCSEGQAYIGLDYNDKNKDTINLNQYDIAGKFIEPLSNITLYGYDNFYKEYILIKKDDNNNSNKIYLAKLEKNGFDMLIEIPKTYSDDSNITIHMVDSENVLVKEEFHDKENKKIKNRYIVYDLAEYFQDNTNKLNGDYDKLTLKNTYKNINDFNNYDSNIKNKLSEENKNPIENTQAKSPLNENTISKDKASNKTASEQKDYREYDSSWRKGNGDWYYYKNNDEKVIGWLKTEKGWYYFYKDGTMQKDAIVIGENHEEYVLGHDGLLQNPDASLNYDYDGSKEKAPIPNNNNNNNNVSSSTTNNNTTTSNDTHNVTDKSNSSIDTKTNKQTNNDTKKETITKK